MLFTRALVIRTISGDRLDRNSYRITFIRLQIHIAMYACGCVCVCVCTVYVRADIRARFRWLISGAVLDRETYETMDRSFHGRQMVRA